MKINYQTEQSSIGKICITPCPFYRVIGKDKKHIVRVGTYYCSQCPHCISLDTEEKYVLCSNKVKTIIKKL